jgi:hypothetical protein
VVDAGPLLATAGDAEFIFAAYQQMLHRPPDIDGLLDHRFLLRKGISRIRVLRSLEESEEGRSKRVRLKNLPVEAELSFLGKVVFHLRLKTAWLLWRTFDRPSEAVEQRIHIADPARFWDLTFHATTTLINRQQIFEGQLHVWRREMEADLLRVREALTRFAAAQDSGRMRDLTAHEPGTIEFEGHRFALAAGEWQGLAWTAVDNHVTAGMRSLLKRLLLPGMVVADAGAGVGIFSVLAGDLIQPGGKVHAFESCPARFALLLKNLESAGRLASGVAIAQPFEVGSPPVVAEGAPAQTIRVTLDAALAAEPRIDILRLSLPGGEEAAFKGLWRILESNAGLKILWDCRPAAVTARGQRVSGLLEPLLAAGFNASRVCPVTGALLPMAQAEPAQPLEILLQREAPARSAA